VRFVVMANIFVTDLQIHRRFDIKGSTEGRTVGEAARRRAEADPSVIFKVRGGGGGSRAREDHTCTRALS
jgi:hypothetical protein